MVSRRTRTRVIGGVVAILGLLSGALEGPQAASATRSSLRPPFLASESRVTPTQLRFTWHPGCPVAPASLRLVHLSYVGFDARAHIGELVVNEAVVDSVERVFGILYERGFPIASMKPEDAFRGSDPASMAADNTSGFNCRLAVAQGPPAWSVHAFGEAIDVNPVQNPYVEAGHVQPTSGARFLDRADVRPGMAVSGGVLVDAFVGVGWFWGGRWQSTPDYQHFSATGG